MRGPIAAVRNGDIITIDVKKRRLDMEVPAAEIKKRLAKWKAPKPRYTTGVFAKYAAGGRRLGRRLYVGRALESQLQLSPLGRGQW